jgi:hypothetical protein
VRRSFDERERTAALFLMSAETKQERIRFPDESGRTLRDLMAGHASGAVIELAPGRYVGPILVTRSVTIRGAGDLTRIVGEGRGSVITVRGPADARIVLDSLLIEEGRSEAGGGITVLEGRARVHNVHVRRCHGDRGGAIHVAGGELDATRVRVFDVTSEKGGALWVGGASVVAVRDSQIKRSEAGLGGAIAVEGDAKVLIEGATIGRARATAQSGGQAVWVAGARGKKPSVWLRRVRFEDAPMGMPIFIDPDRPGEVHVSACDLPRMVNGALGIVDAGDNHWR